MVNTYKEVPGAVRRFVDHMVNMGLSFQLNNATFECFQDFQGSEDITHVEFRQAVKTMHRAGDLKRRKVNGRFLYFFY